MFDRILNMNSVICYSLFGKTEDANKIVSVAMQIYAF